MLEQKKKEEEAKLETERLVSFWVKKERTTDPVVNELVNLI
jgi:hypothetical protein